MKQPFQFLLKILATLFIFWLAFHGVDFEALKGVAHDQDGYLFTMSGVLLVLLIALGALRWHLIIHALSNIPRPITLLSTFRIFYISMFFTCCLPGAVGGDVVRVWLLKAKQLPLTVSINSVIIDRMMALLALILMVVFTMPLLGKSAGVDTMVLMPLVAMLGLLGLWVVFNAEKIFAKIAHWRVIKLLLHLITSVRMLLARPKAFASALLLAFIGQVVYSACAAVLAQSLHIQMNFVQALALMPPVMLATTLPISIGGWGVREMGVIGMLSLIGIPQEQALVLSIQLGLLSIITSLPGSVLWLVGRKLYSAAISESA